MRKSNKVHDEETRRKQLEDQRMARRITYGFSNPNNISPMPTPLPNLLFRPADTSIPEIRRAPRQSTLSNPIFPLEETTTETEEVEEPRSSLILFEPLYPNRRSRLNVGAIQNPLVTLTNVATTPDNNDT